MSRRLLRLLLASALMLSWIGPRFRSFARSEDGVERRLLYVAAPGIRNYLEYGGHGDFTEASGFSVHLPVLRVSVVNRVLEFFLSLASHSSLDSCVF